MNTLLRTPENTPNVRQPALFLSHGGGPWPWVPEMRQMFQKTEAEFKKIPALLPAKPRAILIISGHWEEQEFTVSTAKKPAMVFDYSGFPANTYQISYPALGSPEVAARVKALLTDASLACGESPDRGLDHGTFVPLFLMYPQADIPVVSLSLKASYDPAEHIRMGEALKPLRDEGVLIIGSGLSYHNMRGFRTAGAGPVSEQFETWLNETIAEKDESTRLQRLIEWEKAPAARLAHPHEDHLLPLMVIAGTAEAGPGERLFVDRAMGVVMASYRFTA